MARILAVAAMFAALFVSTLAHAQQAEDPKVFASRFFDALMSRPVDEAYKVIAEETYLARANKAAAITLREATQKGVLGYGSFVSYELVRDQKLGSTYRNFIYLVNHLQLGTVYTLTFYRTPRGWNLVRMEIVDAAAKMTFE